MMKQQPKIQPRTKDGKFAKRGEEREIELATAFWIESTAHIKSEPKLDKATFDVFTYRSGDKRGHGKTPLFMAGMKCLPLCNVPLLSANEERK